MNQQRRIKEIKLLTSFKYGGSVAVKGTKFQGPDFPSALLQEIELNRGVVEVTYEDDTPVQVVEEEVADEVDVEEATPPTSTTIATKTVHRRKK